MVNNNTTLSILIVLWTIKQEGVHLFILSLLHCK